MPAGALAGLLGGLFLERRSMISWASFLTILGMLAAHLRFHPPDRLSCAASPHPQPARGGGDGSRRPAAC